MKIELRERLDTPVFLVPPTFSANAYYRAELPARMTGGSICRSFRAPVDGDVVESVELSPAFLRRIKDCSTLILYGWGMPTVLPLTYLLDSDEEPFLAALRSVPAILFDADDPPWDRTVPLPAQVDEVTRRVVLSLVTGGTFDDLEWLVDEFRRKYLPGNFGLPPPWQPTAQQLMIVHQHVQMRVHFKLTGQAVPAMGAGNVRLVKELIAATPALADAVRDALPEVNVRVAPNAVDPADFQPCVKPKDGAVKVRIGYSSFFSHKLDAALIMPALRECARIPGVQVWFFGWHPAWAYDLQIEKSKVNEYDGLVYHHGGMMMDTPAFFHASSILDVALAPLQEGLHNECRGTSKWFESAMYSIPMVVQDMAPYARVEHGVT